MELVCGMFNRNTRRWRVSVVVVIVVIVIIVRTVDSREKMRHVASTCGSGADEDDDDDFDEEAVCVCVCMCVRKPGSQLRAMHSCHRAHVQVL